VEKEQVVGELPMSFAANKKHTEWNSSQYARKMKSEWPVKRVVKVARAA
jgi:hypothetical protein